MITGSAPDTRFLTNRYRYEHSLDHADAGHAYSRDGRSAQEGQCEMEWKRRRTAHAMKHKTN